VAASSFAGVLLLCFVARWLSCRPVWCPRNDIKLNENNFETVLFQPKQRFGHETFLAVLAEPGAGGAGAMTYA